METRKRWVDYVRVVYGVIGQFIQLENEGKGVEIDGFVLQAEVETEIEEPRRSQDIRAIEYQRLFTYSFDNPFIKYIYFLLKSLLMVGRFTYEGNVVRVDGFRLKNLEKWVTSKTLAFVNLGSISAYCNFRCTFCYEKGCLIPWEKRHLSFREAKTRLRYYDVSKKMGLPIARSSSMEPFCNRHFLDILSLVRAKVSDEEIEITTHGGFLTQPIIKRLQELRPVRLIISINTTNDNLRKELSGVASDWPVKESIPLLRQYGIPFIGSIVGWPSLPPDDIRETIRFLDQHDALLIRVLLPGYSRAFSRELLFSTWEVWTNVTNIVESCRSSIRAPLVVSPSAFWNKTLLPEIDGIYVNSPAFRSGLTRGDVIIGIDNNRVYTKAQAKALLSEGVQHKKDCSIDVEVLRGKDVISATLTNDDEQVDHYPYRPHGYKASSLNMGIFLVDTFKLTYLLQAKDIIEKWRAKNVLILTSRLMESYVYEALSMSKELAKFFLKEIDSRIEVVNNDFLGGNIAMGDLLMTSDYINHISDSIKKNGRPDLIIIPSSFANNWGIDLMGQSFADIERTYDIPVERVICDRIIL